MPIQVAIVLAVVATVLINLGFALQKRGASRAREVASHGGNGSLFRVRVWRLGLIVMVIGWGLYLLSARFAPISLVQPALGAGLAVLALISVFYLKERISVLEWCAFGGMLVGILLLGFSAEEESPRNPAGLYLLGLTVAVILASGALYFLSRYEGTRLRSDVLLGILAGLLIGLGSFYIKAMFNYLDPGLLETIPVGERESALFSRKLIGFGVCLPMVIGGNVLGIAVVQLGFRHGKAMVVVPVQQVTNKAVAIVGGMVALGESLPADAAKAGARIIAFILILLATAALARFSGETAAEKKS